MIEHMLFRQNTAYKIMKIALIQPYKMNLIQYTSENNSVSSYVLQYLIEGDILSNYFKLFFICLLKYLNYFLILIEIYEKWNDPTNLC